MVRARNRKVKVAHSVAIRVFCGQEENEEEIIGGLKWLAPLDFEKEKVTAQRQVAEGFSDRKIKIIEIALTKERHIKVLIESLLERLSEHDKRLLLAQLNSRVDDNANFYVRFEKENVAKNHSLLVTDGGNCYHVRIKVAAYPSTKEKTKEKVKDWLSADATTNTPVC